MKQDKVTYVPAGALVASARASVQQIPPFAEIGSDPSFKFEFETEGLGFGRSNFDM
jgi:hypothetical protein